MVASTRSDRHRRVVSSIGHALTLQHEPEAWSGLGGILRARLTEYERASLLASVAAATETNLVIEVCEAVVPARSAGPPPPALSDVEDDARWWADLATLSELRAYLAACFVRLPARERRNFLEEANWMEVTA
ncbi:hypothetical protein [Marimonas arenosa]|uniref:Uncharacterized protein n=1 Tax=Marimonas arenosa TaxID=1795305 RepID=A0AAE3WF27_9RHOB|nr:hypothetical protein [Marimonas arenosa]MDQ2091343.1 hypothetical protein [Marimonas arenosa]